MFQAPPRTTTYVAPEEPINPDLRYLVKVIELVDLGPSKYPQPTDDPNNPTHRIQWKFRLAAPADDGKYMGVLNTDGDPYEHYDYTSSKTGKSTKAGGKTATARMWMEALYGHPLENDDITPDIANKLRDKYAIALFEEHEAGGQDGQEAYTRLRILRLTPYKQSAVKAAIAEQSAAAEKAAATVRKARATADIEPPEETDIPF